MRSLLTIYRLPDGWHVWDPSIPGDVRNRRGPLVFAECGMAMTFCHPQRCTISSEPPALRGERLSPAPAGCESDDRPLDSDAFRAG